MTYEEVCRKIREHFESQWPANVPMIYPNEIEDIGHPKYFGRLTIRPASGSQIAVGGLQHRRQGITIVQIFQAEGTGTDAIGALEEKATRIFSDFILAGIRFFDVGADRVGPDRHGYLQSNVNASFQFDV